MSRKPLAIQEKIRYNTFCTKFLPERARTTYKESVMILKYDFAAIEPKWQKRWEEGKVFAAAGKSEKPKFYGLIEFPYPSGQGLHVGHPRPYTAMDIVTRKKRMDGYNVLFPMGFDAFGLPTENYAIKNHIHPAVVTKQNIARFTSQLKRLGFGFDWDRVVDTTDPSYYKWTQWIFLQLYKNGLAYKATMPVNWCTSCKCVLANEEVVEGVCERCGAPVAKVILEAYRRGCLFDSWSEYYKNDVWIQCFEDCGVDIGFYTTRERADDEIFPWDFIDCGVTRQFLLREWKKAQEGIVSPNCQEQCQGCGVGTFRCGICPTAS